MKVSVLSLDNFSVVSAKKMWGAYTYYRHLCSLISELWHEIVSDFSWEIVILIDTPRFLRFISIQKILKKWNFEEIKNIVYDNPEKLEKMNLALSQIKDKKVFLVEHGNLETLICHNYIWAIDQLKSQNNQVAVLCNTINEIEFYNSIWVEAHLFMQPVNEDLFPQMQAQDHDKINYIFNSRIVWKWFYKMLSFVKEDLINSKCSLSVRGCWRKNRYYFNFVSEKTIYFKWIIDENWQILLDDLKIYPFDIENILEPNSVWLYAWQPFKCWKIEYALLEYIYMGMDVKIHPRWTEWYENNSYVNTYWISSDLWKDFNIEVSKWRESENKEYVYSAVRDIFNKEISLLRIKNYIFNS